MSSSLINAILWPPLWGMGVMGFISRMARRQRGGVAPLPLFINITHPLYGWCQWLWSGAMQLLIYGVAPPVKGVTIDPAWGSLANVIAAILWLAWKRRKDIKRKLATLGAKGLARLAKLVQTLRERTTPRPVYRPGWVPT